MQTMFSPARPAIASPLRAFAALARRLPVSRSVLALAGPAIALVLGCGGHDALPTLAPSPGAPGSGDVVALDWTTWPGADGANDFALDGSLVLEDDDASWNGWSFLVPEQATVESERGKWIAFEPAGNHAFSPEWSRGLRQLRLRFQLDFPEGFPLYGSSDPTTARHLFGVSSFNPLSEAADGALSWIDVELHESGWQIIPRWRSGPEEAIVTGEPLEAPWAFEHGWNDVELTVILRGLGDKDGDLRLRVGDRVFAWTGIQLTGVADAFRYFYFGRWEPGAGDHRLAVRNLEVHDLTPPADVLPPPYDYARGGYRIAGGFWNGWQVRTHRDNCVGSPCLRFTDHGTYGSMRDHTQGVYYLGPQRASEGQVDMKVRFHGSQLGSTGAGRHLLGITSRPLCFTPREVGLENWTRVDFDRPESGRMRAVVFNKVNGVAINGTAWPTHWFNVPFATDRWAALSIAWRMSGDRLTMTVNGQTYTFTLLYGSEPPGYYLGFGNMDPISGEIDFDDIRVSAGTKDQDGLAGRNPSAEITE